MNESPLTITRPQFLRLSTRAREIPLTIFITAFSLCFTVTQSLTSIISFPNTSLSSAMDSSLKLSLVFSICIFTLVRAIDDIPQAPTPSPTSTPQETIQEDHSSLISHASLLPPILSHLGFLELATAAPSLSDSSSWSGPSTVFAPSDDSLRACSSCSVPSLLREHIIPGFFSIDYLRKLPFGSKIETLTPGRCLTITYNLIGNANPNPNPNANSNSTLTTDDAKVFVGGMEITQPEMFNNGMVVIHGIQGFVSPLSPFSCDVERISSNSFPYNLDHHHHHHRSGENIHVPPPADSSIQPNLMRLMINDAILRLRNNGFSILALAMKVKYSDLVNLNNMTIFAMDDLSIFSGSSSYISNVRFHIVPNHYLTLKELEDLAVGTSLPTLEKGQNLLVTTAAKNGGVSSVPMRINYVRVKIGEVVRNMRIVVHSLYLPFPHVSPFAAAYDSLIGGVDHDDDEMMMMMEEGMCDAVNNGHCGEPPISQANNKPMVEIEEHHGV